MSGFSEPTEERHRVPTLALILMVSFLWGSNFVAMKMALSQFEPFTLSALRNAAGCIVLGVYALWYGYPLPKRREEWTGIFWISFHLTTVSSACFTFGLQHISASLASVLVNTMPFFMVIFARIFLSERPTRLGLVGLAFGFAGAALVASPGVGEGTSALGAVFIFLAAATWASGSVIVKKTGLTGLHAPFFVSVQLAMSFVALTALALWQEGPAAYRIPAEGVPVLLYASIPGLAIPFVIWSEILRRGSALQASATAYLVPLFGIVCGFALLGDRFTQVEVFGGLLILVGVTIVNAPRRRRA
jgi:drug/metabolite transporter (DMT)-like permease